MSQTEPSQESLSPASAINEDKKSIQEEEREKILNIENEQKTMASSVIESTEEKKPKEVKEGMEVKPKKIPIGGIQMPGFFTRSKSKEPCKDDDQTEDTELIEQDKSEKKEEISVLPARIKLPNLFKKSKPSDSEEGDKTTEQKEKIKLLETIRLPLVSVFQRMKRNSESHNLTTNSQAGLASLETLDEKSNDEKGELKTVSLEEKKDVEKQPEHEEVDWLEKLKGYKIAIGGLLLFFLMLIVIILISTRRGSPIPRSPPIRDGKFIETVTGCGKVEGKMEDSSVAFRGIPYARSPVGDLRFEYAKPLNSLQYCWNGTFIAHNATPPCLQTLSNGTVTGIEDCLTLDIITPYVRYDNPLPVIVLIGADSLVGGSPGKLRPSARYARSKDVVFVRPNFRIGALGFLSLDMLAQSTYPHTSGNYGLSDILEALHWVQLNIEHFGGNKESVTLLGHKAGGTLVTALSTIHNAKKYFTRAWASSGGSIYPKKPREETEVEFREFLQSVNCQDVACLRKLPAEKLVTSVQDTWRKPQPDLPSKEEDPAKRHQWLVIDGRILTESPSDVWSRGPLPVDLVIGSTAQAGSSEKLRFKNTNWTESHVMHHVKESVIGAQELINDALKKYPSTYRGLSSMVTDIRIVCPLISMWKDMDNVTIYVANQTRGTDKLADIDSDIEAILGRYEPKTPEQRRYFSAMQGLFYYYVRHGIIEEKMPGKNILIVDQDALPNATYSHCDFWTLKNIVPRFAALD